MEAQAWRDQVTGGVDATGSERDQLLRDAFLRLLEGALEELCDVARDISRHDGLRNEWRHRAALSPEAEVRSVYQSMGRGLPRNFAYVVRQYKAHPELRRATDPSDRARIAEVAVLGGGLEALSLGYAELLDEFELIGDSAGLALLLLAHGVEAAGHLGEGTVSVLRAIWPSVAAA